MKPTTRWFSSTPKPAWSTLAGAVDAGCDLILCVVDPTFESFALAENVQRMAETAGIRVAYVLNKVDDAVRDTMADRLNGRQVIAAIPKTERLFMQSLNGEALSADLPELKKICRFIETFEKPVSLAVFP